MVLCFPDDLLYAEHLFICLLVFHIYFPFLSACSSLSPNWLPYPLTFSWSYCEASIIVLNIYPSVYCPLMGTLQAFDQSSLTSFSLLYWDIPFDWRYVTVFHIIKIPFDFTSSFSYHPLFFCSFLRHWSSKELSLFAILNYFLLPWTHSLTTTTIIRTPPNVFLIFWPVNFFFFWHY